MMFQADEQSSKLKAGRDGRQEARQGNIESRQRNTDRTTKLLIVILVLFLIAEFPLGILGMFSAIRGHDFLLTCYNPIAEILEMLVLVNSAINFILYCLMSSQFRNTGKKILGIKKKEIPLTFRRISSINMEVTKKTIMS